MIQTIVPIIAGAFGWWITRFAVEPLQRVHELRRDTLDNLIYYGNLGPDAPEDEAQQAADRYRRLATGLIAVNKTAFPWVKWWLQIRGYDLETAATAMIGWSNTISVEGPARAMQVVRRDAVEQGLRLPRTYSDQQVEETKAEVNRRLAAAA